MLPDYDEPITTDDPDEILSYMAELMDEAGLEPTKWSPNLNSAKNYLGMAEASTMGGHVHEGIVNVSKPWFVTIGMETMADAREDLSPNLLENTIRHEIAHAIDYEDRGTDAASHDYRWKDIAIKCGCPPVDCASAPTELMARWKRHCPECGTIYKLLHSYAETRKTYVCSRCEGYHPLEVVENEQCLL
jgi:rRNA maturation endonuclease Nob1